MKVYHLRLIVHVHHLPDIRNGSKFLVGGFVEK